MKPIEFSEQTLVIAKDQPEYLPLPAYVDSEGLVTFCWQLSWKERLQLLWSGCIWHQVMTFSSSLQPQLLLTEKPKL